MESAFNSLLLLLERCASSKLKISLRADYASADAGKQGASIRSAARYLISVPEAITGETWHRCSRIGNLFSILLFNMNLIDFLGKKQAFKLIESQVWTALEVFDRGIGVGETLSGLEQGSR